MEAANRADDVNGRGHMRAHGPGPTSGGPRPATTHKTLRRPNFYLSTLDNIFDN